MDWRHHEVPSLFISGKPYYVLLGRRPPLLPIYNSRVSRETVALLLSMTRAYGQDGLSACHRSHRVDHLCRCLRLPENHSNNGEPVMLRWDLPGAGYFDTDDLGLHSARGLRAVGRRWCLLVPDSIS